MADPEIEVELDRLQIVGMLLVDGSTWPEITAVVQKLGLIECQSDHRRRSTLVSGEQRSVCATCENTITQQWRRYLAILGSDPARLAEAKGAWLFAHDAVSEICMRNFVVDRIVTTSKTVYVDGKPVEETTTRTEKRVNIGLLRLYIEVNDKIAKVRGFNVAVASIPRTLRKMLHVHLKSDEQPDERSN